MIQSPAGQHHESEACVPLSEEELSDVSAGVAPVVAYAIIALAGGSNLALPLALYKLR
jgi:hypothetical protein